MVPAHPLVPRVYNRARRSAGFTLIELTVVIALIVVLAGIALIQYRNSTIAAREAVLKEDLFRMRDAIDQYYADRSKYPPDLQALAANGYLRQIPEDPFTKSSTTWVTIPAEPDPANPNAEPGIFDLKSGAPGTALDGTNYADW